MTSIRYYDFSTEQTEMLDELILCLSNDGEFHEQTNHFDRDLVYNVLSTRMSSFTYSLEKLANVDHLFYLTFVSPLLDLLDDTDAIDYVVEGICGE